MEQVPVTKRQAVPSCRAASSPAAPALPSYRRRRPKSSALSSVPRSNWAASDHRRLRWLRRSWPDFRHYSVVQGATKSAETILLVIHMLFSNVKTWLNGTYHGVGAKLLPRYATEWTDRFNRRGRSTRSGSLWRRGRFAFAAKGHLDRICSGTNESIADRSRLARTPAVAGSAALDVLLAFARRDNFTTWSQPVLWCDFSNTTNIWQANFFTSKYHNDKSSTNDKR